MKKLLHHKPSLKNLVDRYKLHKKLIDKHPEIKELVQKKIKKDEIDIINYVTSDHFVHVLNNLNL